MSHSIPSLVYAHQGPPLINPLDKTILPFSKIDEPDHNPFGIKPVPVPTQYNQIGSEDKEFGGYNCYQNKAFYCECIKSSTNKEQKDKCKILNEEGSKNQCGMPVCNWLVYK